MDRKYKFSLFFWGIGILFCMAAYAYANTNPLPFVKSSAFIQGLSQTIVKVKKIADIPIIFPTLVPKDPTHYLYFANYDSDNTTAEKGYLINVDYTINCNGVRVCNVGYLQAETGKNPETFDDHNHKNITEPVALTRSIRGYYTPGHAMGSYFPPLLQWQSNGILYTLSWDDHVANKAAMIAMVNSAIAGGNW